MRAHLQIRQASYSHTSAHTVGISGQSPLSGPTCSAVSRNLKELKKYTSAKESANTGKQAWRAKLN
eukprot:2509439-Pleurochrysis_carterae.AAC.1